MSKKGIKKGLAVAMTVAVVGGQILSAVPANVLAEESNQGKEEAKSVQPRAVGLNYKNTFDVLQFSPASPNSLKIKASSNALISLGIANQGVQRIQIDPEFKEFFQDPNWKSYLSGTMYIRAGAAGLYTNTQQISTVAANQGANRSRIEFDANNNTLNLYGEQVLASTTMNMTNDIFIDLAKWNKDRKMSGYTSVIERKPSYTFKVDAVDPDYISLNFGTNNLADKSITDNSMTWFENSWMENSIEPTTLQSTDNKTFKGKTVQDRINEHAKDYTVELYTNNSLIAKGIAVDTAGNWTYKGATSYPVGTIITAKVVGTEREPNANGTMDVSYSKVTNLTLGAPDAPPVINATDKTIEAGTPFSPLNGVTAIDAEDGNITGDIQVVYNNVNVNIPDTYTVIYKVKDSAGNEVVKKITVTVVKANEAPVISASDRTIEVGSYFDPMVGVNAVDPEDGNITHKVTYDSQVNVNAPGTYRVTYTVRDSAGKVGTKTITVTVVKPNEVPVIHANDRTIEAGSYFDPMNGVTAIDPEDGNITHKVTYNSEVNTNVPGTYRVTYTVSDSAGKQAVKVIYVTVKKTTAGTVSPYAYTIGTGYVSGGYSGDIKQVALEVNGVVYSKVNASSASEFKYYAKDKISSMTDRVYVIGYDGTGRQLDRKQVSINPPATVGSVSPQTFAVGDGFVKGTYTGSVKKVALEVNGMVYGKVNVLDGANFQYYAKDKITSTSDNVYVIGYDANGKQLDRKQVALSGVSTAGAISPEIYKMGDGFVKGTYTGNVKQVALEVNGKVYTAVGVVDQTNFQYYAKDKIQSAADNVYVIAYDSNGKQLDRKQVLFSSGSGAVNPGAYNVGDSFITGTYVGDVKQIGLIVNGVTYSPVNVLDNTQFRYYAKDKVKSAADVIYVVGYDANGKELNRKQVNIGPSATGVISPSSYKIGEGFVSGIFAGSISDIAIEVNGQAYSPVTVLDGANFRYYAKDKIKSVNDIVFVIGYDKNGKQLDKKQVTIVAK
ncbi:immunoglobulin-like domain-containing protein [Listeria kieliensis]|uniref:immunoglobulin-like domain-containing protein n=1 Tax=Listeria kieliensis TaxID=1621700 RepID=UPI000E2194EA|nr:immunoglobulin-like domain-containing protein [Listeria kieliensis]